MSEQNEVGMIMRAAFDKARRQRGLRSDRALAKAIGISPVTLWKLTKGNTGPLLCKIIPLVVAAYAEEISATPAP